VLRPDVSAWLESLISRLHAKQASARLSCAAEVVQELERRALA
jgi:hypothetical protein